MRRYQSVAGLLAALLVLGGCDENDDGGGTGARPPAAVAAATAAQQVGTAGAAAPAAPAVRVTDGRGSPVANARVTFTVTAGGGSVGARAATTNRDGVASAGSWVLGPRAGANVVTASVEGLEAVVFTATTEAGAAAALVRAGGDNQAGIAGAALADSLAVRATDAHGNPVAGLPVTFAVESGGGSLSPSSAVTGADGYARARLTLGRQAGAVRVSAAAGGMPAVDFSARALPGPAAVLLAHAGDEQSAGAGEAVPVRPVVRAVDALGNPVAGVPVTFAVTAGGGSITGVTASTDTAGVAAVGSWTLGAAGLNTLTASSPGLPSARFTATASDPCLVSTAYVFGDTATGSFSPLDCRLSGGQPIDFFSLEITQTRAFTVDLGAARDPFVYLFDAAGQVVASDDDGGPGVSSQLHVIAPAGSYFIGASTSTAATSGPPVSSDYTLVTGAAPADITGCASVWLLVSQVSTSQQLSATDCPGPWFSSYADRYQLQLRAGQRVTIRQAAAGFETYLRVYNSGFFFLSSPPTFDGTGGTFSSITFTAPSSGVYTIDASSWWSFQTGPYTLSIQ